MRGRLDTGNGTCAVPELLSPFGKCVEREASASHLVHLPEMKYFLMSFLRCSVPNPAWCRLEIGTEGGKEAGEDTGVQKKPKCIDVEAQYLNRQSRELALTEKQDVAFW
jgi:hypothetical protein